MLYTSDCRFAQTGDSYKSMNNTCSGSAVACYTTYSGPRMSESNSLGEILILLRASAGDPVKPASTAPDDINYHSKRVSDLLKRHSTTSPEVIAELNQLRAHYPGVSCGVVEAEVWNTQYPRLWQSTHLKSDPVEAVYNLERAGHKLGPGDEKWLRLILTHCCGWSATDHDHLRDDWVLFLKGLYRHIPNLEPVLDSLVWPEELTRFPSGCTPREPSFFLLADSESFYLFILEGRGLYNAGKSLEQVYIGLRDYKYNSTREGGWTPEDWSELDLDERDFFPVYGCIRNSNGGFNSRRPLKPFPEHICLAENL